MLYEFFVIRIQTDPRQPHQSIPERLYLMYRLNTILIRLSGVSGLIHKPVNRENSGSPKKMTPAGVIFVFVFVIVSIFPFFRFPQEYTLRNETQDHKGDQDIYDPHGLFSGYKVIFETGKAVNQRLP